MSSYGFLKGHSGVLNYILRISDWALLAVCGVVSYYLSNAYELYASMGVEGLPHAYVYVVIIIIVLSALIFPLFSIYRVWRGTSIFTEIKLLSMAWVMVALTLMAFAYVTKSGADFSRSWIGILFVSGWFSLVASRVVLRMLLHWLRTSGFNHRHIVIVGTGEQAVEVANRLQKMTWFGLEIAAFFGTKELPSHLRDNNVITDYAALSDFVERKGIDQVWIALPHSEEKVIREVIDSLESTATAIRYVPDIFEYQLMHHSLSEVAGMPVVNISHTSIDGTNKMLKACEDYVLGTLLLLCAAPVMLLIAIGVKLSSRGPVLYRQKRVGWSGKAFTMLKFRTMPVDIEKHSGPVWASQDEARATSFGSFLRKTSLDELPQLFNVLRGEMSLVGPRPERPVFVEKYKDEIPLYMKKHLVKAGVTGWAQVHGWRGNTCLHTRIEHDLYYIENWSLWLDIKIIVMTVFKGLVHKNAY